MVLLDSARRDITAPGLARWLLGVGIVVTLGVNVTAGLHHGAMGAVVSAWPALALVGSYELLMSMIRREAAPAAATTPAPVGAAETVADEPEIESVDAVIEPAIEPAVKRPRAGRTTAAKVATLRDKHPDMTQAQMAARLKVSERTIRRHLASEVTVNA
jgi:hypothetical protein